MSIKPLTQRQQDLIVSNVARAVQNIDSLNRTGYKYLYLCSGFIAHYDLYGFIAHYSDRSLKQDILSYAGANEWKNFRPGDRDYEYYKSKADVYRRIVDAIV